MANKRQGMSNAAYGKSRGLSGAYIGRLVRDGQIPTLADGSIDAEAADKARARNVRLRMDPSPHAKRGDYWQARTVREHFAAKLLQLEYARESGKVLDADKVLQLTTAAFANCRLRMRSLPRSLAAVLIAQKSPAAAEKLLATAIDDALLALADDVLGPSGASESNGDANGSTDA